MNRVRDIKNGLSLLALSLLFVLPCLAQNQNIEKIKEINIKNLGNGRIDESYVVSHISSEVGVALDRQSVSRDVKALLKTGRFSEVTASVEPVGDEVTLFFSLRNKLKLVDEISLEGVEHISHSKMLSIVNIDVSDYLDDQLLGLAAKRIEKEYHERYYPDAKVEWKITEIEAYAGFAHVSIIVDEGKRSRVKQVRFVGNKQVPLKHLQKIMKRRAWWDPFRLFRPKRYDATELDAYRAQIHRQYLKEGFLDVKVSAPEVTRDENDHLLITVNIDEGIPYKVGDVSLEGITIFPETALREYVRIESGDVASMQRIMAVSQMLEDYYGKRGYLNSRVRPVLDPDSKRGIVDVVYKFREGRLTKIRNIMIRGNTRTRDKVIRRELLVYPGDDYDQVSTRRSERRLMNLRYFSSVRGYPVDTNIEDQKDLAFEVEEQRTGNLMMSAAFSSIDKMMGIVELSQANFDLFGWPYFTGGGQKMRMVAQFGSRRERYELDFTEPWFLDRRLSLGVNLYNSSVNTSDYDVERTGAAIRLRKKIPGPNSVVVRYRLEKVSGINETNDYYFVTSDESPYYDLDAPADFNEDKRTRSTLSASLVHDSTDRPFIPSKGTQASLFGHISGGPLGCDTDVYGLGFNLTQYIPVIWGHVFSLRGKYETVEEYDDTTEVPYSERLFMGGTGTLRGYDYRDVGPKVVRYSEESVGFYHRAYGGKSLAFASAEYTIPLSGMFRVAGFYDIGNVWEEAYEYDSDNLASSYGVGLRLDFPGFPIRLDWGWPINKDHEITEEERFDLSIKYGF